MGKLRPRKYQLNYFKWKPASSDGAGTKIHLFWFTVPLFLRRMLQAFREHLPSTLLNLPWYFHSKESGFSSRDALTCCVICWSLWHRKHREAFDSCSSIGIKTWRQESSEIHGELPDPYKYSSAKGEAVMDCIWASKCQWTEAKPVELGLKSTLGGDDASTLLWTLTTTSTSQTLLYSFFRNESHPMAGHSGDPPVQCFSNSNVHRNLGICWNVGSNSRGLGEPGTLHFWKSHQMMSVLLLPGPHLALQSPRAQFDKPQFRRLKRQ